MLLVSRDAPWAAACVSVLDVNPGFDARGVLTLSVSVPAASYTNVDRVVSFYSALQSALEERLGPNTIAIVDELPLTGDRGRSLVSVRPTEVGREAVVREAGTAYFDVMRIPIVAGRSFDRRDNSSAPPRVVVSESTRGTSCSHRSSRSAVRSGWRQQRKRQKSLASPATSRTAHSMKRPFQPCICPPGRRPHAPGMSSFEAHGRTRMSSPSCAKKLRGSIASCRCTRRRSMQDVVAASPGVPARRVLTATFLGFALLAVVLGGIGLFGVVAHDVASRRRELGIRIALGADPRRILSATLGQGVLMVGCGLLVGGVLSIWAARALSGVLLTTDHLDALSIGVPAAVLMAAGFVAVLPTARRASRTDPLAALRSE